MKRSDNGGASWSRLQLVHGESNASHLVTIGNPAPIALTTQPGKVVLVYARDNSEVFVMTSLDFGNTWGAPKLLPSGDPSGPWPWVATGPPQGLQLPSGRLIVACDHRLHVNDKGSFSHTMYSDDEGDSWALSNVCIQTPNPNPNPSPSPKGCPCH
jgi:sialidase-1